MRTLYEVLRPGRLPELQECELGAEPSYEELKNLIEPLLDGAWLEHVSVLYRGQRTDMFVDEEGLLKNLPLNPLATKIYHTIGHAKGMDMAGASPIVGTAIVFHRRVWF